MIATNEREIDMTATEPAGEGLSLFGLVQMAWRRKWLVLLALVFGGVLGGIYYAQQPPEFQASAKLLVTHKRPMAMEKTTLEAFGNAGDFLAVHIRLLTSPFMAERIAKENFGFQGASDRSAIAATIVNGLSVRSDETLKNGQSNILTMTYRSNDKDKCQAIVNGTIKTYLIYLQETYKNESEEKAKQILKKMGDLETQIGDQQRDLRDYRSTERVALAKKGSIAQDRDGKFLQIDNVKDVHQEIRAIRLKKADLKIDLDLISKMLADGASDEELARWVTRRRSQKNDDVKNTGLDQLAQLTLKRDSLAKMFGKDHPEMQTINSQIEILQGGNGTPDGQGRKLAESQKSILEDEWGRLLAREQVLQQMYQEEDTRAAELLAYEEKEKELETSINNLQAKYDSYVHLLKELRFSTDAGGFEATEISPTVVAQVGPSLFKTLLLSLFLGGAGGLGLAYLANLLDKSFHTPEEIRAQLGVPVMGHIPKINLGALTQSHPEVVDGLLDPALVAHYLPKSFHAEAFRGLRTALTFSIHSENQKVIQMTSPNKSDGKSTVIANLAISLANSGKKVLLVDADLRRPRQHKIFGLGQAEGLSELLTTSVEPADLILSTSVDGLDLLPGGTIPNNPAELLSTPRFSEMLHLFRDQYDYVLVDTPPLLSVTDPSIVSAYVDGICLVINLTKHARTEALRAREILATLSANLLGVVVNAVADKQASYYTYETYYRSYYEEDTDKNEKLAALTGKS